MRDRQRLLHLFVAGPYQQRGIARALWTRAKSDLLNGTTGQRRLLVKSSMYAIAVYERFGFKACGPPVEEVGVTYVPMEMVISHGQN